MNARATIARRLTIGMAAVGLTGAMLLFFFIAIEYGMTWRTFTDAQDMPRVVHEIFEHVLMPVLLLILPMTLAARFVIRRALAPLVDAAARVDAAPAMARGFRIDTAPLPVEALPFAQSVNALLERLDRAAADQEAFAADVAHELRTPLTLLALEADRMEGEPVARMRRDIAQMRRLIEQLMLLAQLDADLAARVGPASVALSELASDVAGRMAPVAVAEDRHIAVEDRMGDAPAPVVPGRREALAAALRNLVENALRVTPEGGTVTILVGPGACLSVRDEGAGLPPERLAELVRRLRRGDHASADGAGLGLAIVERIVHAHGGTLSTLPAERTLRIAFPTE